MIFIFDDPVTSQPMSRQKRKLIGEFFEQIEICSGISIVQTPFRSDDLFETLLKEDCRDETNSENETT